MTPSLSHPPTKSPYNTPSEDLLGHIYERIYFNRNLPSSIISEIEALGVIDPHELEADLSNLGFLLREFCGETRISAAHSGRAFTVL